ncbi:hypothetical protein IWX90DRAFT_199604 [Phyllosticta citrichinensis]|uniref:Uncharacterized protein n=1 Tax=Phyllosticta citrichinensis TaxID=1130410 RepID=A0ABR1XXM6_9PEZI
MLASFLLPLPPDAHLLKQSSHSGTPQPAIGWMPVDGPSAPNVPVDLTSLAARLHLSSVPLTHTSLLFLPLRRTEWSFAVIVSFDMERLFPVAIAQRQMSLFFLPTSPPVRVDRKICPCSLVVVLLQDGKMMPVFNLCERSGRHTHTLFSVLPPWQNSLLVGMHFSIHFDQCEHPRRINTQRLLNNEHPQTSRQSDCDYPDRPLIPPER